MAQIPMVKGAGILGANYGGNHTLFWCTPATLPRRPSKNC
jgi:hypothetical protein